MLQSNKWIVHGDISRVREKEKRSNAVSSRSNDKLFNDFESSNKMCLCLGFVQHAMEDGNELLSNGEAEDQLGSDLYNPISCQKPANFFSCFFYA